MRNDVIAMLALFFLLVSCIVIGLWLIPDLPPDPPGAAIPNVTYVASPEVSHGPDQP